MQWQIKSSYLEKDNLNFAIYLFGQKRICVLFSFDSFTAGMSFNKAICALVKISWIKIS